MVSSRSWVLAINREARASSSQPAMRLRYFAPCCLGLTVWAGLLVWPRDADAHDWYPLECCGGHDCAPADNVIQRSDGSLLVTARGMSVVIPKDYPGWRKSPDERIHVCIRKLRSGSEYLICAFRSPGV
jgi:hypothetical protein